MVYIPRYRGCTNQGFTAGGFAQLKLRFTNISNAQANEPKHQGVMGIPRNRGSQLLPLAEVELKGRAKAQKRALEQYQILTSPGGAILRFALRSVSYSAKVQICTLEQYQPVTANFPYVALRQSYSSHVFGNKRPDRETHKQKVTEKQGIRLGCC